MKTKLLNSTYVLFGLITGFAFTPLFADNEIYQGQNLSGQSFFGRSLESANFKNCILLGTDFSESYIKNAIFENADIRGASFFLCSYDRPHMNSYNPDNFRAEQIYSTASYKRKDLTGVDFSDNILSGWNFSGQNLTDANFQWSYLGAISSDDFLEIMGVAYPSLQKADFSDAIINGANFCEVTKEKFGFSSDQLYSTLSYKRKDLSRIKLAGNDLSAWNFSGQNLQNASFNSNNSEIRTNLANTNFTKADLRGVDMRYGVIGNPIYKNTIMTDGRIENFSMSSVSDSFSIRKYKPASSGGALISAKLDTSSTISGGSALTLERGADFEITNNSTLSVTQGSVISINTDASSSTSFSILAGSGLVFENGAILEINLEGIFTTGDSISFVVFDWENGGNFEVIGDFVKDESIFLSLNGEKFNGDWNFKTDGNNFIVNISQVPEPATYAAMFGIVAMFFVYNRRKTN